MDPTALRTKLLSLLAGVAPDIEPGSVDPERALREANAKFRRRFAAVETEMRARGLKFSGVSLAALEELWQNTKENAGF